MAADPSAFWSAIVTINSLLLAASVIEARLLAGEKSLKTAGFIIFVVTDAALAILILIALIFLAWGEIAGGSWLRTVSIWTVALALIVVMFLPLSKARHKELSH